MKNAKFKAELESIIYSEDAIIEEIENKLEEAIAKKGKVKLLVYSVYENGKHKNLDEIAVPGKVIFKMNKDPFFGGIDSKNYTSRVVNNPTWLQVSILANDMMNKTGDEHHCFLEGISNTGKGTTEIPVYRFLMGS